MPTTNVSVAGMESYQPAVDYRKTGRVAVLAGTNFAWDAAGVHSAYASRLVAGVSSIGVSPAIAQSVDVVDQMHVMVDDKVWRLNPTSPGSPIGIWQNIKTLARIQTPNLNDVPYDYRKWSAGFLGGKAYVAAWNYGVHEVNTAVNPPTYTRLTAGLNPGFPADVTPVIAICETNGRMVYLTKEAVYWSAPNAPKNLTPALGGAGFQVIAERIGGTPYAITKLAQGAVIWTSEGGLAMEFTGGNSVFRFFVLPTQALPISAFAISRLPDDTYLMLTRLGMFSFGNMTQPVAVTPMFNEFLRDYLRNRPLETGHAWYSITDNRLYLSMRTGFVAFEDTYTLDVSLDRWGLFSEQHIGLFDYGVSRGQLAYATPQGVAHFLLSVADPRKNREVAPGVFVGLGSSVTIGWIRAEELVPHADVVQELLEIVVNRLTPANVELTVRVDEEYVTSAGPTIYDEGLITAPVTSTVDEGTIAYLSTSNVYRLQVITDIFTIDDDPQAEQAFIPDRVRMNRDSDLWVTIAPSMYFRLMFIATDLDEFFRVNSMDLTVSYQGNLS